MEDKVADTIARDGHPNIITGGSPMRYLTLAALLATAKDELYGRFASRLSEVLKTADRVAADIGEPGLPYHVLLRAVLDCTTVTDALEVRRADVRDHAHARAGERGAGPCPRGAVPGADQPAPVWRS